MAMKRLSAPCVCCGVEVELYRDHISGPNHYRCGNCFELYNEEQIAPLRDLADELKELEDKRHALIAAHGFGSR